MHKIKKNTEVLVIANTEIGLEANADKLSTWSCHYIRMEAKI